MTQEAAEVRNLMLAIAHNAIDSRAELDEYQTGEYDAKHDPEGYVTSLLNALHQWAHHHGIDWEKELARAQGFFEQDIAESQPEAVSLPAPEIEDLRCPKCGQNESFVIEVSECLLMFHDGTVLEGDTGEEWDDSSSCRCHECQHMGSVYQFRSTVPNEKETTLHVDNENHTAS